MVRKLEPNTDVKETLESVLFEADNFQSVIIIALKKDGKPFFKSSDMIVMNVCFLIQFVNAYLNNWLIKGDDNNES